MTDHPDCRKEVGREPPANVLRALRQEVGYCCPIPGCDEPYLEWHHFDPPFAERPHHEVAGMIALCSKHHRKADRNNFTVAQLREYKNGAAQRQQTPQRSIEWLRRDLLVVAGNNFCLNTPRILKAQGRLVIWLTRDLQGYWGLNLAPLGYVELSMTDNFWQATGPLLDFECPPGGTRLRATYPNRDEIEVVFREFKTLKHLRRAYRKGPPELDGLSFPLTAVDVHYRCRSLGIDVGPSRLDLKDHPQLPGSVMKGCFVRNGYGMIELP